MSSLPPVAERVKDAQPTIWVQFTALAAREGVCNLGQGFPDYEPPSSVTKCLADVTTDVSVANGNAKYHQYTRSFGHPPLIEQLKQLYCDLGLPITQPMEEILVTVGAYQAIYYACMAFLNPGDEAIFIEPAFDCYQHQIALARGKPVRVVLRPHEDERSSDGRLSSASLKLDMNELAAAFTDKTRLVFINNPHNPAGKVWTRDELEAIAALAKKHNCIVIADEVYEWMTYDDAKMIRFATLPDMWERTITIGSAGKTFSVTGWKTGWALGPAHIIRPLMMIHQNCNFTCPTVLQEALARAFAHERALGLSNASCYFASIVPELAPKRDRMARMIEEVGLRPIIPQAGYFMLAEYQHIDLSDDVRKKSDKYPDDSMDFRMVKWLINEKNLAAIPTTGFCSTPENKKIYEPYIRFCFFKREETLEQAAKILHDWAKAK